MIVVLVSACTSKQEKKESVAKIATIQPPAGNAVKGKILFATCATCHGTSGEGNKQLNGPALANTDDWYLYRQLMNFRKDIRGASQEDTLGFQMAAMAKVMKDSLEIGDVLAYINTLPDVTLPTIIKGDIKKGERAYQSVCGSCHGPGARGNEKMNAPRLNGIDDWYLKSQISKFKRSIRGAHPADKFGAQMIPMVTLLANDQAVDDVIAYIRSTTSTTKE